MPGVGPEGRLRRCAQASGAAERRVHVQCPLLFPTPYFRSRFFNWLNGYRGAPF